MLEEADFPAAEYDRLRLISLLMCTINVHSSIFEDFAHLVAHFTDLVSATYKFPRAASGLSLTRLLELYFVEVFIDTSQTPAARCQLERNNLPRRNEPLRKLSQDCVESAA